MRHWRETVERKAPPPPKKRIEERKKTDKSIRERGWNELISATSRLFNLFPQHCLLMGMSSIKYQWRGGPGLRKNSLCSNRGWGGLAECINGIRVSLSKLVALNQGKKRTPQAGSRHSSPYICCFLLQQGPQSCWHRSKLGNSSRLR